MDEFLGQVTLPLADFDMYERAPFFLQDLTAAYALLGYLAEKRERYRIEGFKGQVTLPLADFDMYERALEYCNV